MHAKLLQSCLTLFNPMDYSPPGSSVHGILQARLLEWVAIPFSRGSSYPGIESQSQGSLMYVCVLMCICITGSLCCTPEINTTLYIKTTPVETKKN